jgi:hypothetical protein
MLLTVLIFLLLDQINKAKLQMVLNSTCLNHHRSCFKQKSRLMISIICSGISYIFQYISTIQAKPKYK